ncbi:hypothetical protein EXM22_07900 [Oceanispirochaeta crateris]|uniref:M23 family metallopeptidase n=1 Tax=Oceanispirochaeta crateris TaxID=2518645 RepID=A0A5C1QIC7_9SPIO|nr:hypothetical protein [Oceanispirochaeta crateris]QEN07915.1 hypothetical protein EXM22_07900 [Oceanispirochaeta crateris]
MTNKRILQLILLILCSQISALQWPVSVEYLESCFLEDYNGEPFPGLIFSGYDSMRPFDFGETIFRFTPGDYSALPPVEGSMLVLEHENGFQSIYTHISEEETRADRTRLSEGEYLKSPEDGPREGHSSFYIRDALQNQLVNPLILLPGMDDFYPPVIESVILSDQEREYILNNDLILPVGRYQVYIKGWDIHEAGRNRSPYEFSMYNLGTLQLKRVLDAVIQKDNDLYFQDGVAVSSVFFRQGYLFLGDISLTSGQAKLEVVMSDAQGNEDSTEYTIQVIR